MTNLGKSEFWGQTSLNVLQALCTMASQPLTMILFFKRNAKATAEHPVRFYPVHGRGQETATIAHIPVA